MSTNEEVVRLFAMSERDELLEDLHRKENDLRLRLDKALSSIGGIAARERDTLGDAVGGKRLDDVLASYECREEAERKLSEAEKVIQASSSLSAQLDGILMRRRDAEEELRKLSVRLGAMIYEQCSFSLLDREVFAPVYQDIEMDRKLTDLSSAPMLSRLIGSGKARMRKMGEEGRFISYAHIALSSGAVLHGDNASSLLSDASRLDGEEKDAAAAAAELRARIADSRDRVRSAERSLSTLREDVKKAEEGIQDAELSYGRFLYERGYAWVGSTTPSMLLDAIEEALGIHEELDRAVKEREMAERNAAAEDYMAMMEIEKGKIEELEMEKARIDREIAEIRQGIEEIQARIRGLQG